MNATLLEQVKVIPESDGSTDVLIPPDCLWDCIECFGENRLDASFTFNASNFTAHFSHASSPRVSESLRNWSRPVNPAG